MDDQIVKMVTNFLSSQYRDKTIASWAEQKLHLELDSSDVRDITKSQLATFLLSEADRQADALIMEQLDINLPDDEELHSQWNWGAMAKWANQQYALNLNDRDLKKIDRNELHEHLYQEACKSFERWDLSDLDDLLDPAFEIKSLCGWAGHHFTLQLNDAELAEMEPPEIEQLLKKLVRQRYDEKEISFPCSVGLSRFLSGDGQRGEKYNRESLARWAGTRFKRSFDPEEWSSMSSDQYRKTDARDQSRLPEGPAGFTACRSKTAGAVARFGKSGSGGDSRPGPVCRRMGSSTDQPERGC